jgi:molybdate transport system ATP-binding protein
MILKCRIPLAAFVLDVDAAFDARVTCIFGPSGAGKTTLLDATAGLREIAAGEIVIDGKILFSSTRNVNLSPQARSIGYVPQEAALFPHLPVRKNILYGAGRGEAGASSGPGLEHVVELLEIGRLLDRPVKSLSGGESQRVALARALLSRPQLLLLDEPLASLDIGLKERIIPYLRRVRDEFGIPMIYVTHDPVEVLSLADWVVMIKEGRLVAQGVPQEVLMSSKVLAQLEKDQLENVFDATLIESDIGGGRSRVRLKSGQELFIPCTPGPMNRPLQIGIRGDDILLATKAPEGISAGNVIAGIVRNIERAGGQAILRVEAGEAFYVRLTYSAIERLRLATGAAVFLIIKTRSCIVL